MEIKIRWLTHYCEASIIEERTTIELGLLDENERADLVSTLVAAANELCGEGQEVVIKDKE